MSIQPLRLMLFCSFYRCPGRKQKKRKFKYKKVFLGWTAVVATKKVGMHICVRCNAHLNLAFLYVHLYSIWLFNSLLFLVFFCGEIVKALFFVASYARHSHSCIHMILYDSLSILFVQLFFIIRAASSDCHCTSLI